MMKRRILTMLLSGALLLGLGLGEAQAIDFKAKGRWQMGFMAGELNLINKVNDGQGNRSWNSRDQFGAAQRVQLQMEAVASESLSGTVFFQIGSQHWGRYSQGAALGADGMNQVKVRWAYIDWLVPETDIKVRMGLHSMPFPRKAGGSAVFDVRGAGITVNWMMNENFGLNAIWMRASNDNYTDPDKPWENSYLDNMDMFLLSFPIRLDGFEITPWASYGFKGRNTFADGNNWSEGNALFALYPYYGTSGNTMDLRKTNKAYGDIFWAGLPIGITLLEPWNFEFDFNYGYVSPMGRYGAYKGRDPEIRYGSTQREGWVAKALVEYKMDWGIPGVFGWYGSGDDGNIKNGSERMPTLVPYGTFTSFVGDGNLGWLWQDYNDSYSGTWGIGAQVKDISFLENLKHTIRTAWWGGTNSPAMAKYMDSAWSWIYGSNNWNGPYMTTNDGMLEVNFVNTYQMYDNMNVCLEFDYLANFMDNKTWNKAGDGNTTFRRQDAWKTQLTFTYSF